MIKIINKADCCGCNACGDACAHDAITFETDIEGFWYPKVDMSKCTDCHLCEKVCPIINIKALKKNDYQEPICYAAEHKNIEVVFDSTSGGLFSALAEIMYRSKGYVGGAVYNDDFTVRQYISNDKEDLPKLRSSKYLQSNLKGFYKQVKQLVIAGEQVLVCGTPCQMATLRAFLRKDYDNLIIADFICRGINSPKVWLKYIASFEERYGSPVVYSKAKSKEYGWRNLTQKVILADGRHIYETKDQNDYTKGYLGTNAYCRPSCYDCKFKGFPRMADISLADFWGIEKVDKSMDKNLGTSLVMVNSKKGEAFFEKAKARAKAIQVPFETILPGNFALTQSLPPSKVNREEFFADLDKMTFTELAKKYIKETPITRKQKIKQFVRTCIRLVKMPFDDISLCKTLKYNTLRQIFNEKYFAPYKNSVIQIDKQANININGMFSFGYKRIKGSKLESRLLVEKGATLEVNGRCNVYYGADIEVFNNAKLVIQGGGGPNINFTCICGEYIEIGKNVQIGRGVTIRDNNGNHYINRTGYKNTRPVIIGDKAWLCEGCTIMPGVKVGEGAIVGAHAFVTQNVPAHSIVSGNPAQVVDTDVLWKY
jgi:acetyltransferase-like isoleucine patch superfamily enzyme/coenzyme F420-reducing hydrogenase beta subunit